MAEEMAGWNKKKRGKVELQSKSTKGVSNEVNKIKMTKFAKKSKGRGIR